MQIQKVAAQDGEEIAVRSNNQEWKASWHPPSAPPAGTPHGASAVCVTGDSEIMLISHDAEHWGLPGGRTEEACATVVQARLLRPSQAPRVQSQHLCGGNPTGSHSGPVFLASRGRSCAVGTAVRDSASLCLCGGRRVGPSGDCTSRRVRAHPRPRTPRGDAPLLVPRTP